jgi:hypothetical protein
MQLHHTRTQRLSFWLSKIRIFKMEHGSRWAAQLPCSLMAYGYGGQESGLSNPHASFSSCAQLRATLKFTR